LPPDIRIDIHELSELRGLAAVAAQASYSCPKDTALLSKIISALLVRWERINPKDATFLKNRIAMADPEAPSLQVIVNILIDRFRSEESRFLKWLIRCLAASEDRGMGAYTECEDRSVHDNGDEDSEHLQVGLLLSKQRLLFYLRDLPIPPGMHWTPIVLAQRITLASYLKHMEIKGYSPDPDEDVAMKPDPYPPLGSEIDTDLRRLWLIRHEASLLRTLDFPCRCNFPRSLTSITQRQDDDRWIGECDTTETVIVRILSEWHGVQDKAIRELLSPKRRAHFNPPPKPK
jgi:hypothetical protein